MKIYSDRRYRLEDIMQSDLSGVIDLMMHDYNVKGINRETVIREIDWLVSEVDLLTKLEDTYRNNNSQYLKQSSEAFKE